MLKFAIVGVGGLGKVHLRNALEIETKRGDVKLVALCDVEKSRFTEEIETNLGGVTTPVDISKYNLYYDINDMLANEKLDFIITAVPTYLHEALAVTALKAGVHVFSEKPMAINLEQAENMIKAAKENKKLLMIGQCLRYWPEYVKLKELIESEEYGKLVRAEFSRYSPTPLWSWKNWMMDFQKSGGAALDMHVHDVDYINYVFGKPESVTSVATHNVSSFDSILTQYAYKDITVTSSCDWGMAPGFPFRPQFLARFEKATLEMIGGGINIYRPGENPGSIQVVPGNAYINEINDLIDCIKDGRESLINKPENVLQSLKIALCEIESATKGEKVYVQ